jgi:hypothetical protein
MLCRFVPGRGEWPSRTIRSSERTDKVVFVVSSYRWYRSLAMLLERPGVKLTEIV